MSSVSGGNLVQIFISYRRGLDDGLKVGIANVLARSFESAELFLDEPPALAWPMTPHEMADVSTGGTLRRSGDDKRSKDGQRRRPRAEKTLVGADAIVVVCRRPAELDELKGYADRGQAGFAGRQSGEILHTPFLSAHDINSNKSDYLAHCIFMRLEAEEKISNNPKIGSGEFSRLVDLSTGATVCCDAGGVSIAPVATFNGSDSLNVDERRRRQPAKGRFASKSRNIVKSNVLSAVDLMTYNYCIRELSSIGIGCAAIGGFFGCGPCSVSVLPAGGRAAGAALVANRQERNMPRQGDTEAARPVLRPRPREKKRKIVCQIVLPTSIGPSGLDIADSFIESQSTPETPAGPADEADDKPLLEEISLRNFGRNIDRLIADMANERELARPNGRSRK